MPVRAGEVAMTLRVRALREEEGHRLARMTRSQKLGAGLVRRAQIIQHAVDGLSAPGIAAKMGLCGATVRFWLKRFNERGLSGLAEDMRSGRPPTYTAEERSAVIAAALSRPADLGLPFTSWTLDRLVAYLGETGIGMKRSRGVAWPDRPHQGPRHAAARHDATRCVLLRGRPRRVLAAPRARGRGDREPRHGPDLAAGRPPCPACKDRSAGCAGAAAGLDGLVARRAAGL